MFAVNETNCLYHAPNGIDPVTDIYVCRDPECMTSLPSVLQGNPI